MTENKAIIAICVGHTQAEKAIAELQQLGFARTNLSVFGKAYASDGNVVGCYTSGGHLKTRGGSLAFWDCCGICSVTAVSSSYPTSGR